MRVRTMLGALDERPFRLLWLGQTASSLGDSLVPVALAFAVLDVGGPRDLGVVWASYMVARAGLLLVGGVWADRLSRRFVMLGADLARAGSQGLLAAVLLLGVADVWHLAALSALAGAASAFFNPAAMGIVPETVSPARLQEANGLIGVSRNGVEIFGPALSGLLVALVGPGVVFALDAATFVASAACLAALRLPARAAAPRTGFVSELVAGWREVQARTWLCVGFAAFAVGNTATAAFFVLGPVVAKDALGGAKAWGVILTAGAVGAVLGSALSLRIRPERPLVACFPLVALYGVFVAAFAPPFPLLAIAVLAAMAWGGIALANTLWDTAVQQRVPRAALSRVNSIDAMVSFVFMPVGYLLVGPIVAGVGLDATLLGAATLIVLTSFGVALVPAIREVRRVEVEEARPAVPAAAT